MYIYLFSLPKDKFKEYYILKLCCVTVRVCVYVCYLSLLVYVNTCISNIYMSKVRNEQPDTFGFNRQNQSMLKIY